MEGGEVWCSIAPSIQEGTQPDPFNRGESGGGGLGALYRLQTVLLLNLTSRFKFNDAVCTGARSPGGWVADVSMFL